MKRRDLMKLSGLASAGLFTPFSSRLLAAPEDYSGRFFVTLQAEGAWDATSFCDPKTNVPGEWEINWWARTRDIETAGNINYAPFGNNSSFFQKYYRDMLVINGVDTQTNSHSVGVVHSWSGRNSVGYPSLTTLFAAANAPDMPLSYINFGGYGETAKLMRSTRLDDISSLMNVLRPNTVPWNNEENYRNPEHLSIIQQAQQARLDRLRSASGNLPREKFNMDAYYDARNNSSGLESFAQVIPSDDELQSTVPVQDWESNLLQQIQIATLAFKSGVASAADLYLGGFDTHTNHDQDHEPLLAHLTDALDYLWTYAETEGIADRLTVMVTSDFSRTPYYNETNGKDHWPITSVVMMEKDAPWANRVIGYTDEGHNAYRINPTTLERDDANGTLIYPKHIHESVRNYLGVGDNTQFPLNNTETFDFFSVS